MLRVLSASGLTASANLNQPNVGYKWKIIMAQIKLTTGTGTGSRSAVLGVVGYQSLFMYPYLASASSSTASSSSGGTGGVAGANPGQTNLSWNAFTEIRSADLVQCNVSLVSGDTVSYYLLVDEVLDE